MGDYLKRNYEYRYTQKLKELKNKSSVNLEGAYLVNDTTLLFTQPVNKEYIQSILYKETGIVYTII